MIWCPVLGWWFEELMGGQDRRVGDKVSRSFGLSIIYSFVPSLVYSFLRFIVRSFIRLFIIHLLVGRSVGLWQVHRSVCRLVNNMHGRGSGTSVGRSVGRSVDRLGRFDVVGWKRSVGVGRSELVGMAIGLRTI